MGVELGGQAEPRVRASIKDSKPSWFTINHQDWMGRQTREIVAHDPAFFYLFFTLSNKNALTTIFGVV